MEWPWPESWTGGYRPWLEQTADEALEEATNVIKHSKNLLRIIREEIGYDWTRPGAGRMAPSPTNRERTMKAQSQKEIWMVGLLAAAVAVIAVTWP